jgi:acyl carrier protein phosphodiesterase
VNYLAHLYLAESDPESLLASLMGDFVRGRLDENLAPAIRRGIQLHRKIDTFTDTHPVVKLSKERIQPYFRRYAAILVDVFYDHFLAKDWALYSPVTLRDFTLLVYQVLQTHYASLPSTMQRSVRYMIANDLLMSYREVVGIGRSLCGIERRLSRESGLGKALVELDRNYELLANDFAIFFPELKNYSERMKKFAADSIG